MIELNKIYNEDCMKGMKHIFNNSIDCIICDLPYGILNKKNKHAQWDKMLPLDKLWQHYNRIIKDNGVIVLFGQGMFTAQLMMSNQKMWRYNLVWDKVLKSGFLNANRMPLRQHEDILVFYNKQPVYNPQFTEGMPLHSKGVSYKNKEHKNRNYGKINVVDDYRKGSTQKYPSSILKFEKTHPSKSLHPTQKPVALIEWLIKTYTNEFETVLDNCMGSGTTAIACINTNRNYIGFEIEKEYYNLSIRRVQEHQLKLAMYNLK